MTDNSLETSFNFHEVAAGAGAGFAEHFFMFPLDTLKTRLQSGKSRRLKEEIRAIFLSERFAHFYRGCVPILASAVPAHAAYFGVYEAAKRTVGESFTGITISASFATIAHDTITTPFDVVKQRMQMDEHRHFASSVDCAKRLMQTSGYLSFFRSLPTTIAMNIPFYSTHWLVYERILSRLGGGDTRDYEHELSWEYLVAGSLAGAAASIVSFPLDTVKTHLQLSLGTTVSQTVKNIFMSRGVRGLFSGVSAKAAHTSISGAIVMVTYENLKKCFENK